MSPREIMTLLEKTFRFRNFLRSDAFQFVHISRLYVRSKTADDICKKFHFYNPFQGRA